MLDYCFSEYGGIVCGLLIPIVSVILGTIISMIIIALSGKKCRKESKGESK